MVLISPFLLYFVIECAPLDIVKIEELVTVDIITRSLTHLSTINSLPDSALLPYTGAKQINRSNPHLISGASAYRRSALRSNG